MTLPLGDIREAERNVHLREKRGDETFAGLVESIRANGLLHRIVVRPANDGLGYVIVDGHRRFKAAKAAGMADVPVEIRNIAEDAALAVTIAANVQRIDNDPLLEAEAIERMLDGDYSREEIAAAIGKSVAYVARRARLISLARPWREFAKRVPCTTDLLERVAAHETQLQERVAADLGLDEYEYDGDNGDRCPWGEFEDVFRRAVMKLSDAAFDAKVCANCPSNTACHEYLFDFMADEEGNEARCQDPACYARRNNEAVDAVVESLRRKGTPALEVADKWRIPEYWNVTARRGAKNTQAYIYHDGDLLRIAWSVPPPKRESAQPAMTAEEKAARREERRRNVLVKSARDKIRELLKPDEATGMIAFFDTKRGGDVYDRVAARRLERDLHWGYLPDSLIDDFMAEAAHNHDVEAALDADEMEAYALLLDENERREEARNAADEESDGEGAESEG